MLREELISFKGIKEGIYIFVKNGDFNLIKEELKGKLEEYKDFFNGASILGIRGESLEEDEIDKLVHIMEKDFGLGVDRDGLPKYLDREESVDTEIKEGMTKFHNLTIRSGQIVEYNGNIVIIGDVNPGALVRATGNIVILGKLRGVAHAGVDGNINAYIAANELQPTQLRIGNIIARKPDEGFAISDVPEIARVNQGEVLIQPYLAKKQ